MTEAAKTIEGATLTRLLSMVKIHTGITMEERKREMLFSRLRKRLRTLNFDSMEVYLDYMQTNPEEVQQFINLVTTNETLFFRTPVVWDYFQKTFLSEWYAAHRGETLKIWSAAASSGEEACSIAISCEEFKLHHPTFRYRIEGTDISTDVLGRAKSGVFKEKTLDELKTKFPTYFAKYFKEAADGTGFRLHDFICANMDFSVHNLQKRSPKQKYYDIVFLRNVLIYFNEADQELVLNNAHETLKNGGVLIVGESESLARLKTPFSFAQPLIYRRGA
jgi:chemotaxis protein methyltransferase CheR